MKKSFLAAILATLAGCASMGMGENESNEQLLAAAGFHLYLPRNAEEERNLKAMPQRRVIYMDKAVKPTYLYADHDECDCIYVGGQAEVDQFQKLLKQKQIADERVQQAEYNQGLYGMGGMYGGMYGMGGMYPMGGL